MYWIYLIIFVLIVFVPSLVQHGISIFNVVQTQEYAILFLGFLGFFLFLVQEKRLKRNMSEKNHIERQVHRMSKDLTTSYSYIGEINRKLDILENIALGYPESSSLTIKKQKEIYASIMEAVHIFGKTNEFSLRFVKLPNYEIIKEIKSLPEKPLNFSFKNFDENKHFFVYDEYTVATSPRAIDSIFSYIIIKKSANSQTIEDVEIMKTLAAQALFIFMFTLTKRQIKCVI